MAPRLALPRMVAPLLVLLFLATGHTAAHEPPTHETFTFASTIGCSVAYFPLQTADLCSREPREHELVVHPHLTTVVVWLDAVASPHEVPLKLYWTRPIGLPTTTGDEVLHVHTPEPWPSWHQTQLGTITIRAAPGDLPNAAIQQPYRVCIGLFYDGATMPDGYHPCPEQVE